MITTHAWERLPEWREETIDSVIQEEREWLEASQALVARFLAELKALEDRRPIEHYNDCDPDAFFEMLIADCEQLLAVDIEARLGNREIELEEGEDV